jgi:3-hydroxyisobutyrate dehydrogenase-like beta-hydroxyacid dehydrogenase
MAFAEFLGIDSGVAVRLILEAGRAAGARTPLSEIHEQLLSEAVHRGVGASDNSAIIEVFRNHESLG